MSTAPDGPNKPIEEDILRLVDLSRGTQPVREMQTADGRLLAEHLRVQAIMLDQARDAIIIRDFEDRILFWNRSAERLYGWSANEAGTMSVW